MHYLAFDLWRRNAILAAAGWCFLALGVVLVFAMPFDDVELPGIDRFIKPAKFSFSILIYLWSLGWFSGYIDGARRTMAWISGGIVLAMVVEIVCIAGQSFRARTSHFNFATGFDAAVFSLMGTMIIVNTLLAAAFLLVFVWRSRPLPPVYSLGIILGFSIFLPGSAEATAMLLNGGHAVGVGDGGRGLPLVNWSTEGGDLRAAHLLGLHALQVLPIAGWLLGRSNRPVPLMWLVAAGYLALMVALFAQAMMGVPVVRIS